MSTDLHPTVAPEATDAPATRGRRSVTTVIAVSLATGAAAALALTLGVFAGATESVITGAALLAFGIGWGLLAALSGRLTTQPQRWATVPAVAMSSTGISLLVTTPGDAALERISWVWPPVAMALAVWMFTQIRRSLAGRGRWLLTPVVVLLGVASVGATYENVSLVRDQGTYAAPGRLVEVNGHRLHLDCHGQGGPTVVLVNGMGGVSGSWARVTDQLGATTRVCAYDRAGQGWSEDADSPQDGVAAADDLHALLAAAGEHGPYVLAGHSTGGTYSLTYAARYPEQVAGMVLLDSSSPRQATDIPSFAGEYAVMRRGVALLPSLTRLGIGRLAASVTGSHLPAPAADRVTAVTSTAHAARNVRDEQSVVLDVFRQARALTTFPHPLVVLTASESLEDAGWAAAQERFEHLSTDDVHRVVDASHLGLLEDERPATESARAIHEVVTAVRTGSPLAQQ